MQQVSWHDSMTARRFTQPTVSRRQMLGMTGLGFGSLALTGVMHEDGRGADVRNLSVGLDPRSQHFPGPARAVIQLMMTGGPSQMDLFDPKPVLQQRDGEVFETRIDAFQEGSEPNRLLGSPFRFRKHGECGMDLSELMPHLATVVDDICYVRSFVSVHNNHTEGIVNLACGKMFIGRPTLGAWISYALGTENQNLPSFVVLRDPDGHSTSGGLMSKSGWLPALYGGTEFSSRGNPVQNLTPAISVPDTVRRRGLQILHELNEEHRLRYPDESELETRIRNYELAARMQMMATEVLDISQETAATRTMYGLDTAEKQNYGARCLMARRLVERGVRFVQVFASKGQAWDHHSGLKRGLTKECFATDQATTALIVDLKQRGLLDSTVVMWGGEFGRMPVAQSVDGRDHNKRAGTYLLTGGGFRGGCIYGKTDDVGYTVVENRLTVPDMFATILHQLGLDHRRVHYKHAGRFEDATDSVVTGAQVHRDIITSPLRV